MCRGGAGWIGRERSDELAEHAIGDEQPLSGEADATAIVLCRDNNVPLQVFNLLNAGDLLRIVDGEDVGTVVANA